MTAHSLPWNSWLIGSSGTPSDRPTNKRENVMSDHTVPGSFPEEPEPQERADSGSSEVVLDKQATLNGHEVADEQAHPDETFMSGTAHSDKNVSVQSEHINARSEDDSHGQAEVLRDELQAAQSRVASLEGDLLAYRKKESDGDLIDRHEFDQERKIFTEKLEVQTRQRIEAEKKRRSLEQEIEDVTAGVFEEANKMVSVVQREKEQLRLQLVDKDSIISSREAECNDLKSIIQKIEDSKDAKAEDSSSKSGSQGKVSRESLLSWLQTQYKPYPNEGNVRPESSSPSLLHLVTYILTLSNATQSLPYSEFLQLIGKPKNPSQNSRGSTQTSTNAQTVSGGNTNSLMSPAFNTASAPSSPILSPSSSWGTSSASKDPSYLSLKDTKFGRRCISEEIDPTVRLDNSSLSYWTRSKIHSAIIEGNLIIEPIPPRYGQLPTQDCTICSESPAPERRWQHVFRRNRPDSDVHVLCYSCVKRLRSACDFINFLRQVREGLWSMDSTGNSQSEGPKVGEQDKEFKMWDECNRLRLCMAMSRWGIL